MKCGNMALLLYFRYYDGDALTLETLLARQARRVRQRLGAPATLEDNFLVVPNVDKWVSVVNQVWKDVFLLYFRYYGGGALTLETLQAWQARRGRQRLGAQAKPRDNCLVVPHGDERVSVVNQV